ncbi:MAG TPA: cyclic nucleotide-binding domain-containing protein [Burkholderiales bacterium]|nr:cyclic nucleotide-binding domain-containing protein [Burkholderiales bacterium]
MDLDFTQPAAQDEAYDPAVARKCFESFGKTVNFAEGEGIFAEGRPSDTMYYLVEGEVALSRNRRTLDIVRPGEIFGEIAVITQQPRSAAAAARRFCQALVLDARQFQQALQATPEFALMLMNIMNNRLRLTIALMKQTSSLPAYDDRDELRVFDKKTMEDLVAAFRTPPPQVFPPGRVVMKEGDAGVSMYVVIRGRVSISIQGTVVDRVGPGGTFGEMALVDKASRTATATAQTECQLLTISRSDFLGLVKTKPGFAISLLKAIADRLRNMTAQRK